MVKKPEKLDVDLELQIEALINNFDTLSVREKEDALKFIQNYNMRRAGDDFSTFVRLFAPLVLPDPFEEGEHIWLMARELQAIEEATRKGIKKRLQISIAPRSMKTVLLNLFIAWCFGRNPRWKVMHLSHTQSVIEDVSGGPIKDIILMPEFQIIFPETVLRKDARAKNRWGLTLGGIYACFGIAQGVAGRGANIVIVDDPLNEKTAESKTEREKVTKNYVKDVRSRIWKLGSEIAVGTRFRIDDLLGHLQKLDGTEENPVRGSRYPWKVISIPAILDKRASGLLGLPEGGSYWPGTKSMDEILELKRSNAEKDWLALYMQTPTLEEGNIFKKHHFRWIEPNPRTNQVEPPNVDYILVSLDTAFSTKEAADKSAICVYGLFKRTVALTDGRERTVNNMVLLDFKQGQWSFPDLCNECQLLADTFSPDIFVVEQKGSGISLIQELVRRGIPVTGYVPDRDKTTRAHAVTPIHLAGRVWFPKLSFAQELYEELKQFPQASHDDAADAHVLAVTYLKDTYDLTNENYASERQKDVDPTDMVYSTRFNRPSSYFAAASGNF